MTSATGPQTPPGGLLGGVATASFTVGNQTVLAVNDGEFTMSPTFLSDPQAHASLAGGDGAARLPIGCFLLPGDINILIDTGFGSDVVTPSLRGGQLLGQLAAQGFAPEDIDVIALSHLHADHTGGIASVEAERNFPAASIVVGKGDWEFFIEQEQRPVTDHLKAVLHELADSGRLTLIDSEVDLSPTVRAMPAPGHTPGHTVFAIHSSNERALLLGDSMYCPQQLSALEWEAAFDVDQAMAKRTRIALYKDMEAHDARAVGCHFPGLQATRLLFDNG